MMAMITALFRRIVDFVFVLAGVVADTVQAVVSYSQKAALTLQIVAGLVAPALTIRCFVVAADFLMNFLIVFAPAVTIIVVQAVHERFPGCASIHFSGED
jgi:zinc transporter ZupT